MTLQNLLRIQGVLCALWTAKLAWHVLIGPRLYPPLDGVLGAVIGGIAVMSFALARMLSRVART